MLRGRNLVKQRFVHPQNEALDQAAANHNDHNPANIIKAAVPKGNDAAKVVKLAPLLTMRVATQTALVSELMLHDIFELILIG